MLKKISSLAAGSYGYSNASRPLQVRRRSLDEEQLRRQSRNSRSDDSGTDGSQPEGEGLKNAMEMLIAENKHLKELIHERDARASSVNTNEEREEVEALRKECNEAKDEAARLRQQLEAKGELIESMKRERVLQSNEGLQELQQKIKSLEAQLEFECKNHAEELEEKESRIAELEMQLLDAQQQKPSEAAALRQEELSKEERQQREELKSQLAARTAELSRKDAEISKLQAELAASRAEIAERKIEQATSSEDDERVNGLNRRISILEAKLSAEETKRIAAEEALARHRTAAAETKEDSGSLSDLKREIQEKDAALQGMSQQLLEVSAEKDELEQQLHKLREAPSAPETPRALSSKRSFFGRSKSTALERDALASRVQQLEDQLQKLNDKRVELERTRVKLEGQLGEAVQDVRQARKEKEDVANKLKEREAALEALRLAHADVKRPLDVPQNIVLPLPKGSKDTELEATAQLVLKDGVIRTLSSRIAFLQFALKEVTAEKEALLAQPATVALQQETKKELQETSAKYRNAATQRSELRAKVEALTQEVEKSSRQITALKAALEESQKRLSTTADKFKEQNDRYRTLVSSSLTRIEELQDEVSRERNSKILVGKVYRQEMLELRKAAVHAGGVQGDPVRPLSAAREQRQQQQQLQPQPQPQQQQQRKMTQVVARSPQEMLQAPSAPPPVAVRAQQPLLSSGPLRDTNGEVAATCCPFSNGIPVTFTAPTPGAEFAVIPLCFPENAATAATAATAAEGSSSEQQQRPTTRTLHAYGMQQQDDSTYTEGWQQPEAAFADPAAFQEYSAAAPAASSVTQQPSTRTQPPSLWVQTKQGTPSQQHQQIMQDPQQQPGESQQKQQEAAAAAVKQQQEAAAAAAIKQQHRPFERAGVQSETTETPLSPRKDYSGDASMLPKQHLHSSAAGCSSSSSNNSSSNSASAALSQVQGGEDSLSALTFRGDLGGAPAPSAPIDRSSLLRDLQQMQSKKKVLFTSGHASRGPQQGPPVGENPFEADDDSAVDLS
ncbi:hypothetical protein, conserved [Eimeria brunetti]|uniref:Uncharacterized protein n=1 Tax=Eimeria brunetti TaxID=51314 RepID=U6LNF7_9EIME|nr:hypothetical protein, conserved [Eimeria brunetti]